MFNETTVVAASFVLFVIALFKPAKNAILAFLDEKVQEAVKGIEEAKAMRKEAEEYFSQAKHKLSDAEKTALEIVESATARATAILTHVEEEVKVLAEKKSQIAMARIAQQEKQIIEEIKREAVELAMQHVQEALVDELDAGAQMSLIEHSIKNAKRMVN